MKWFTWTVQIKVHETWVADGFNLTQERLEEMLFRELDCAEPHEASAKILTAPAAAHIRKAQGYPIEQQTAR